MIPGGPHRGRRLLAGGLGLLVLLLCLGWGLAWWLPLPDRLLLPGSSVLRWRDGSVAYLTLAPDDRWRVPVDLDQVDPAYLDALVRLEDRRFWWHPGVDPVAIGRAAVGNLARGRVVSGASTITMQVVRLSEPRPRTLRSKVVEALRAVQLELRLSKREILSAYVDLVPMGGNIEGVEAASQAWFGHGAESLTAAEIAVLLAIPQDPAGRAPSVDNTPTLRAARDAIAGRLLEHGLLETHLQRPGLQGQGLVSAQQVLDRVRAQPVPTVRRDLPRNVPHAASWLLAEAADGSELRTTLDAGAQARVEAVVRQAAVGLARKGIDDLAVVVVEHETGDIAALVGGSDFWADRSGAQIPAFLVPRSPGSTLKPFLYADALDRGLILPSHLLLDVPVSYGGYAPSNYDGTYDGMVTAEDALSRSLNVPFVRLLERVGVEPFLGELRSLGATSLDPTPGHYGLSLIIGGVELSPLELAGMYATLARGGSWRPLRVRQDQPRGDGHAVISAGAAWLTTSALARRDRPDFPARAELGAVPRHIHWKTGTSFGNRDAWAVGSGARYTVAVWTGNLDRRPSAWLVGAEVAGPVLFDLLDALDDGHDRDPRADWMRPDALEPVEVCALSGHLPTDACTERRQVLALTAHVPTSACPLHRRVELDQHTGLVVGPGCRQGRQTRQEVRVAWPPAVQRWLSSQYRDLAASPPVDPSCRADLLQGLPPAIMAPRAGQVVLLIPGVPADQQEIPLEAEAAEGTVLTWFVDGRELGRGGAEQRLWWVPQPGMHELLVTDRRGRSDRVRLEVRGGGIARAESTSRAVPPAARPGARGDASSAPW